MNWSNELPTEEMANVLLRWVDENGVDKYCLGEFAKDTEGVIAFYDEEHNKLIFVPGEDSWFKLIPPTGINNDEPTT